MLVLLSDLHVTDGSTAVNVHETAYELLASEIESSAKKKEANEVHVVLLGDILDFVRTDFFHRRVGYDSRPWNGKLDPVTAMNIAPGVEKQFQDVLELILHSDGAKALHGLLAGLPQIGGQSPKVTYVIGNHDRVLHNFNSLKKRLNAWLPGIEFATHIFEKRYGVLACHGHEWDENCHGWEFRRRVLEVKPEVGRFDPIAYRTMAIGEVVTAELMSGLVHHVAVALGDPTPADKKFLKKLKDVNNVRPVTSVFAWLSWFTQSLSKSPAKRYVPILRKALLDALDGTLDCRFAKKWDNMQSDLLVSGDLTDHLAKLRTAVEASSDLQDLGRLVSRLEKVVVAVKAQLGITSLDDLAEGALTDFEAREVPEVDYDQVQYIVYGHTHESRHDIKSATVDGRVQMYVNTGTFLPFVDLALDGKSFLEAHRMTNAMFFRDDEDTKGREGPGPTVDFWSGFRKKRYA